MFSVIHSFNECKQDCFRFVRRINSYFGHLIHNNTYNIRWLAWNDEIKANATVINGVITKINEYDKSSQVNGVTINGMYTWFDKATRVGLRNSTNVLKKLGNETTSLWVNNKEITIKCD
jgi:uncharacterized protein YacL (UPF0231 family)